MPFVSADKADKVIQAVRAGLFVGAMALAGGRFVNAIVVHFTGLQVCLVPGVLLTLCFMLCYYQPRRIQTSAAYASSRAGAIQ